MPTNEAIGKMLLRTGEGCFILKDNLINLSSDGITNKLMASAAWDALFIPVDSNVSKLIIKGVVVWSNCYFLCKEGYVISRSENTNVIAKYNNTNGLIDEGTKMVIVNLSKASNPSYDNLQISKIHKGTSEVTNDASTYPSNLAVYQLVNKTKTELNDEITSANNAVADNRRENQNLFSLFKKSLSYVNEYNYPPYSVVPNAFFNKGSVSSLSTYSIYKFKVDPKYRYKADFYVGVNTGVPFIAFYDKAGKFISDTAYFPANPTNDHHENYELDIPENAAEVWILKCTWLNPGIPYLKISVQGAIPRYIDAWNDLMKKQEEVSADETLSDVQFNEKGIIETQTGCSICKYSVEQNVDYLASTFLPQTGPYLIGYEDGKGNFISSEYAFECGSETFEYKNLPLNVPENAKRILINTNDPKRTSLIKVYGEFKVNGDTADSPDAHQNKLMKLHIYGLTTSNDSNIFYVRTKYNDTKDIILLYMTNLNSVLTPKAVYIGANTLSDAELMNNTYVLHAPTDSTAPFFFADIYWHLFAQHGCPMPVINNTNGMTSDDIGSVWKDQLNREYTVGNVTSSQITLLTKWTDKGTYNDREWRNSVFSTAITSLTHVSGGKTTANIDTVSGYSQVQLRPVMKSTNRKFILDGKEITQAGDYYGDEFQVSETQIGFDPSTIKRWFPDVELSSAEKMAIFTWSYNFKGATCCVNTTVEIKREIECRGYGACQQQFFIDSGNYKAMFLIPKVKPQKGVTLDKPFNSGSKSSPEFSFFRNNNYLNDVNDPYDRQIGYLYNESTKDYKGGLAAGLSLVSGDTVKQKRCDNMQVCNEIESHNSLGLFSPSNTNKFYIMAINTHPFKENGYRLPVGYFKEINYYVSYFDPAENKGQVYWYKDGNSYVIYCHCQETAKNEPIKVPDFMEGLKLEIVEKTENTELLTDRITNGKFFVNWNNDDANYIVLKTV